MSSSFFCRLFGCGANENSFSARIDANQGFSSPAVIPEIAGWTVSKQEQTEIYKIQHNLGLTDPERQLHIVATPVDMNTFLIVESVESNQFTISTWHPNDIPKQSAFMFIARQRL